MTRSGGEFEASGEFENSPLFNEADVRYLHHTLGFDTDYLTSLTQPLENEYGWLMNDSLNLRESMRATMVDVAIATGQDIDDDTIAEWEPTGAELDALYQHSGRLRRRVRMVRGMQQFVADSASLAEEQGVPLRPYQRIEVEKTSDFILNASRNETGGKSGALIMPTGYGKTAIFAKIIAQLKHGEAPDEPARVLVIAPNQNLAEQAEGQGGLRGLQKFAPHLDVGMYYQYKKELNKEVTVTTIASFIKLVEEGRLPDVDAIVVDELHTMIGDSLSANALRIAAADKMLIGVTATDRYDDERTVYSVVDHRIHEISLRDAVHAGRLSPVRGHLLTAEPQLDRFTISDNPKAREKQLRVARLYARIEASIPIIKDAVESGRGVLVRCPAGDDIDLAVELSKALKDMWVKDNDGVNVRWIRADFVGGSTKRQSIEDRHVIFSEYDNADVDVLTYVKAIGMGWDSTHAKVWIDIAGSASSVEVRQGIGRVGRLSVVYDEDNNPVPIPADVYSFRDPGMRRQYTVLDALNSKSGELIAHTGEREPPIPGPSYAVSAPSIIEVDSEEIEAATLEHTTEAVLPSNAEVNQAVQAMMQREVEPAEASRILGLGHAALRHLLLSVGSNPNLPIPKSELVALSELAPSRQAEQLPEMANLVSLNTLAVRFHQPVRLYSLLPFARRQNITPHRYKEATGVAGYYFTEEEADRLVELVNSGEFRLVTYQNDPRQ